MTAEELEELMRDCPTLYHMAERGSWPSIRNNGLLSTSAILDELGIIGAERRRLECQRRPENVTLQGGALGHVVLRDQKPMDDSGLKRCLQDGLTPSHWYRLINERVFFWLTKDRLQRLLNGQAYCDLAHDVIEVDTRNLVAAHRKEISLSPMNSGCTKPFAHPRGLSTFTTIENYPYAHWRGKRKRGERVVELAVTGGVRDIAEFVNRVAVMKGNHVQQVIWRR